MRPLRMIAAALVGVTVLATQALAADPAAVRTMLEKSGFVAQYTDLGEQMRQGMINSPPPMLPPGVATLMASIVGNTMDGKKLLDEVQTVLAASLSDEDVAALSAFFDSDLGSRIVKAEVASSTLSAQEEISAKTDALVAEVRKDPERLAVFNRIDTMLHTAELSARSSESMLRAMAMAMAEASPMPPQPGQMAQADARIKAMHAAFVAQARTMVLAAAQYGYRDLSTAEMKRYADFLETDPSLVMYAAFSGVMDTFYAETGKRIGEELAAAVRQRKT